MEQVKRRGFIVALVATVVGFFTKEVEAHGLPTIDMIPRPFEQGVYNLYSILVRGNMRLEIEHVCKVKPATLIAMHKDIALNASQEETLIAWGELITKFVSWHKC